MNLRNYELKDFEALVCLYRDFFNEMREWQGWEQIKLDESAATGTTRESLEGDSWVFVAEDDERLVGFARVQLWDGAYFVREVFVAKAFRREGLGSSLLARCEDFTKEKGESSVYLVVEPKHSVSLRFLIHNGYDTLNMLELRKDFVQDEMSVREGNVKILGHKLHLLKRKM